MERIGYKILLLLGILMSITLCIIPAIEQSHTYHNFSDNNTFLIPNFWNVISNIPFILVGGFGLYKLKGIKKKVQYVTFFIGIILVGFGSGYYHFSPNNFTLVWDRMPMTIVFMSLLSIIISEFINLKTGYYSLFPMLFLGLLSIIYWVVLKDLRPYVFVQFYPMLAIPVILIFFKSRYNMTYGYWLLFLAYLIAKVFEFYDEQIFASLKIISGHSLKHIMSSFGLFILFYSYLKRETINKKYNVFQEN